ncbi:MAG: fibronectin type III domain-containing protein [Acetobacter sp.]|nr:fibronectin type III domain-containing protein [Bacteroides sp.]MCM1340746.1 fibronectin type III domain-containing protein [Acetobacter sp.]MCM1433083.1 fibronectin type III domain-containing protein [Clostridiales bacterium]
MKKTISFIMSLIMLVSVVASVDLSALAWGEYVDHYYKDGTMSTVGVPDPPEEIVVSKTGTNYVTLQWYAHSFSYGDTEEGVQICKYSDSSKTYSHVAYVKNSEASQKSYRILNLKADTTYKFALRAYSVSQGEKVFGSYTKIISVRTAPKTTTLKSVKYVSTGKMKVTWKKVSGVSGYIIKYSPNSKITNDSAATCTILVSGANNTSRTINGLAKKKYYVKVCTYKTTATNKFCSDFSDAKSVNIKKGASLKTMLNSIKTDTAGRKLIKSLTDNGVDIAKYDTTYDRIKAIYNWHSKHNTDYGWSCMDCNMNFNSCLQALMQNSRNKYDKYLFLAAGDVKNADGSVVMHKWSVFYISGVAYIFDPRLQGYTSKKTGTDYFGILRGSQKSKMYLFDGYMFYYSGIQDFVDFKNCLVYSEAKPAKVTVKSVKAAKKGFKLNWTAQSSGKGYQIVYSTNSKFSSSKSVYVDNIKTASKTISGLKSKKTYYVKIRAYKKFGNAKLYGTYSKVYKVKTK